ncbi:MarR family winged helix-turn-helix transcriptional regulator [Saprospira grandis]|uniref:MarR family winged helix-turn-helix transcriptional regulator n=1 Tax=Saprospira grandis TaxID=1008 RepID=UPI0022DDDB0E|nr:MarR family transcriptional regulator [Saprospira grandis]WBM73262.1 MarR family transcriptional regulator [Saprospira grandis]
MKIEEEINQQRPFKDMYQKVGVNILFTASWLSKLQTDVLKPYGLSVQQFNILRILRGMRGKPATVKLLTERMIDKTSNASRLVEKLQRKGLVLRKSCKQDRRRVDIYIEEEGLKVLAEASAKLEAQMTAYMSHLEPEEAGQLSDLLDQLRG